MRAVGVRGGAWAGAVNAWGDVFVDGQERLRWFVAADDRWYRPSRETTVRQREISGVPVIETRIKVPGGDAVQRVYGVANLGGAIVVEIYNDSSLPFAVAFDRGDIATMREPSPTGVQGIDLPAGSVVFPVGHHATMRAAILIDESGRRISAQELESLPSFEQVERGWLAALRVASRVDVPEASWATVLTTQRCKLLLGVANSRLAAGETEDAVDLILDRAERVKLGDKPSEWIDEVATATESIIRRCAKNRTVQWFEQRAILSASMVLHRAGETRGQHDIAQAWSRLLAANTEVDVIRDGLVALSGVRQIAWIESQLVVQRPDYVIEICPRGIDAAWLGANFECHKLVASPEHLISFAVRWHGEKPALLWEIDGPIGARVAASAVDHTFSSTEMRGETLLTGFAAPQTAAMK
ncbi:MAG: hypothetical protein O3A62_06890 [Actinomycetota bacterium]|nr:hypothetical protein [Actinomycetota bacterium]MDA3004783.1 hypothetical protein [Actinomycetota bacterium]